MRRDAGDGAAAGREVRLSNDTMVAAYLIDPARRRYPLDELIDQSGIEPVVEGGDEAAKEAARAAVAVRALSADEREAIDELELRGLLDDIELPLVDVLYRLELQGVKLDTYRLGETAARVTEEVDELEHQIFELAGEEFTIGSPQQLGAILFEKLELSRKRRGKTGFSTDARVLRAIRDEHPIIEKVERWRELTKLRSTYLDELPSLIDEATGRLHTTFNQTSTTTGRLSSTDPNLQNIPIRTALGRQIRSCFIADEGAQLISADYSQVELRILAHVAGEDVLKAIFERGEDVHTATAAEVLKLEPDQIGPGERSRAKAVNFGIVYGLSAHGLSEQLAIPHEEAAEYIERYLSRFPAVQAFIDRTIAEATDRGYVQTLFGRRRMIPELRSRKWGTRSQGERLAVNTIIQGTAADIIKIAMVRCDAALREAGLATRLVLTIHDELLFEGPLAEIGAGHRAREERDGGRLRAGPPAGGGHRRGRELAGCKVRQGADRGLATAWSGGLIALQAPINSGLGKASARCPRPRSPSWSGRSCWSDRGAVSGQLDNVTEAANVRWYYLLGGLLGAAYVTTVLLTVRTLGAGGVTAATVSGQLTDSVVIDRRGPAGPGRDADHARPRDRRRAAVRRYGPGDQDLELAPDSRTPSGLSLEVRDLGGLVLDLVLGVVELRPWPRPCAPRGRPRGAATRRRRGRRLPSSYVL